MVSLAGKAEGGNTLGPHCGFAPDGDVGAQTSPTHRDSDRPFVGIAARQVGGCCNVFVCDAPKPVCCAPIGRLSGSRKGAKAQRGTQRNAANCSRLIAMQQPRCILALPWLWDVRNGGTMQPPPSLAWGWISRGSTKESRGTNIPDPQGILRQFVGIAERHVASSHSRVC